jgi:molecular chaperone GrpE
MDLKNPFRRGPKPNKPMDTDHTSKAEQENATADTMQHDAPSPDTTDATEVQSDSQSDVTLQAELDVLRTEHQALHDKHVRLFAEFDNFRKRSAKERLELIQFAGENTLKAVLPVVDDFDRAMANNEKVDDIEAVKEGLKLIHHKLLHILASQGLKPMEKVLGEPFDTDRHEAITKAPAPNEKMKGKVIDVVENGYTLHDKVIRYAKVVVGE